VPNESEPTAPRILSRKQATRQPWTGEKLLDGDSHATELYERADLGGLDLRHSTFSECAFVGCDLTGSDLTGAHLVESDLTEIEAAHLTAPRSLWRHSSLARSRLGAVEAYEANFDGLVVADTKISYLNGRSATWKDVLLQRCVIEELDLVGSRLARVRFESCQIRSLELSRTSNTDVDLRGAEIRQISGLAGLAGCTITPEQLYDLSGPLATHLGIAVAPAATD
jgi:uncharacterized protein YjbI with pentapeptide repeats